MLVKDLLTDIDYVTELENVKADQPFSKQDIYMHVIEKFEDEEVTDEIAQKLRDTGIRYYENRLELTGRLLIALSKAADKVI